MILYKIRMETVIARVQLDLFPLHTEGKNEDPILKIDFEMIKKTQKKPHYELQQYLRTVPVRLFCSKEITGQQNNFLQKVEGKKNHPRYILHSRF